METSLHRQLKQLYAGEGAQQEVVLDGYRIDVVDGSRLIEIQHGSLAAIRDKVRRLLAGHDVLVVKPIVFRKTIVSFRSAAGPIVARRLSPKRGCLLDAFEDLVYFTRVFPHPRLAIDLVPVEIEEHRYPGHGRRRRWRRRDHVVADQMLVSADKHVRLIESRDLVRLLGVELPSPFHTADLAERLGRARSTAQQIAYCLRQTGAICTVGKQRNTLIYELAAPPARSRRKRAA